jgi:hypothetical protein
VCLAPAQGFLIADSSRARTDFSAIGVLNEGPQWNYTAVLNIVFVALAIAFPLRFFRTGGPEMLRMMGMSEDTTAHHGDVEEDDDAGHQTTARSQGVSKLMVTGNRELIETVVGVSFNPRLPRHL